MSDQQPIDAELFRRTAPAWNCISDPAEGPHYMPGDACLWCGASRDCRYPNCWRPAVRAVAGQRLCEEHAAGYEELRRG